MILNFYYINLNKNEYSRSNVNFMVTGVLVGWAIKALCRIYCPGYGYHKAGITLMEIVPAEMEINRNDRLMTTLGAINGRYGHGALRLAAEGIAKGWQMLRSQMVAPNQRTRTADPLPSYVAVE